MKTILKGGLIACILLSVSVTVFPQGGGTLKPPAGTPKPPARA